MTKTPWCCWIGGWRNRPCRASAEWLIVHGPGPEDYTHACTDHVGELLTDASEHRIYRLGPEVIAAITDPENQPNQFGVGT